MPVYYPPVGFYFKVAFHGGDFSSETSFQEVSGLSVDVPVEELREGGELRFVHRLPKCPQYSNLVLKRGLLTDSKLRKWVEDAVQGFLFKPVVVQVVLLNSEAGELVGWTVYNARPAKWVLSPFNSKGSNEVVIETLELAFDYFKVAA